MGQRVVLVGAGHAHLETIANIDRLVARGGDVTLVAPEPFRYTGTATGELAGRYAVGLGCVDVAGIARSRGARVLVRSATHLETQQRRVHLDGGEVLDYDWLSLDLGSSASADAVPGLVGEHVFAAKRIPRLIALRERLRAAPGSILVAVLGGGATGCEVAANVKACQPRAAVTLVTASPHLLDGGRPASLVEHALARRGIAVVLGRRVVSAKADALELDDLSSVRFDLVVDASGALPNRLNATSDLALDIHGAVLVEATLRAESDQRVFAVGDGAIRRGVWPQKNGVHAVREGRVLLANLLRAVRGEPLLRCRWPARTLQILDLGDGTALAMRGRAGHRGRECLWWKSWIDRRWLRRWSSLETAARTH